MAFVGNRVSRMIARTATDDLAFYIIFPIQRYLFRQDLLEYPQQFHPIALCVCIGIVRAVSPYAASFQGSRFGRVVTRHFFISSKNRWLPTQRIKDLNLLSDDCQEKDEVTQTADLVIIARLVHITSICYHVSSNTTNYYCHSRTQGWWRKLWERSKLVAVAMVTKPSSDSARHYWMKGLSKLVLAVEGELIFLMITALICFISWLMILLCQKI